jgi:hypothetical protein
VKAAATRLSCPVHTQQQPVPSFKLWWLELHHHAKLLHLDAAVAREKPCPPGAPLARTFSLKTQNRGLKDQGARGWDVATGDPRSYAVALQNTDGARNTASQGSV